MSRVVLHSIASIALLELQNLFFAIRLVPRPVGYLTFTGAIRYISASTTILCFAAFHPFAFDNGEFAF